MKKKPSQKKSARDKFLVTNKQKAQEINELFLELKHKIPKDLRPDLKELSQKTQTELDSLLQIAKKQEDRKTQIVLPLTPLTKLISNDTLIPVKNKKGNFIWFDKKKTSPSPYIIDLKKYPSNKLPPIKSKKTAVKIEAVTFSQKDLQQFTQLPAFYIVDILAFFKNRLTFYRLLLASCVMLFCCTGILYIFHVFDSLKFHADKIFQYSENAFLNINYGQTALAKFNFDDANKYLGNAARGFLSAEQEINNINPLFLKIILKIPKLNEPLILGQKFLAIGSNLTLASKNFALAIKDTGDRPQLSDKIAVISAAIAKNIPLLQDSSRDLMAMPLDSLPENYQKIFTDTKTYLPQITGYLQQVNLAANSLLKLAGHETKKRYLVLFQNNAEIRATGGFIGSFALVDVYKGTITKIEVPQGGAYDLQGGMLQNIAPPQPLQLIATKWQFHDANWFADFPTSAKKLAWFYEESGGPTVDGVIAINLPVMENLLKILGPIDLPLYQKTLSADNFWLETQKSVELEYDKQENKPKKIIADLAPKILEKISHSDVSSLLQIAQLLKQSLLEKNILIYTTDTTVQNILINFDIAGNLKNSENDFLAVFNTNIAGGKTDRVITQEIAHQAHIMGDGRIIDTVTISRTHTGKKNDLFTGIRNVNYIRIYTPQGSKLISVTGFTPVNSALFKKTAIPTMTDATLDKINASKQTDPQSQTVITVENNKTVFGNWLQVDPGQTIIASITYELPFKLTFDKQLQPFLVKTFNNLASLTDKNEQTLYSLQVQKQPGAEQTHISHTIKLPASLKPPTLSQNYSFAKHQINFDHILTQDWYLSLPLTTNY